VLEVFFIYGTLNLTFLHYITLHYIGYTILLVRLNPKSSYRRLYQLQQLNDDGLLTDGPTGRTKDYEEQKLTKYETRTLDSKQNGAASIRNQLMDQERRTWTGR